MAMTDVQEKLPPRLTLDKVTLVYPLFDKIGGESKNRVGGDIEVDRNGRQWVKALNEISLSIAAGEKIGLTGHNGAGKSTLLRLMAGTEKPTSGSIERVGRISTLLSPAAGMKPQASGYDNIRLRGLLQGMTEDEIENARAGIAEFTQLGSYLGVPVAQYSSGMRLRLAFAIATAVKPEILLIDEWIGAGDRAFRQRAERRLGDLMQGANILVLASHSPSLLETFCDKFYRLDQGRITEIDISDVKN